MDGVRRQRVYRHRRNPLDYFDDIDFVARYRLTKEVVRPLAARFALSPFISTTGDPRGNGLHPEARVSTLFTPSFSHMMDILFLFLLSPTYCRTTFHSLNVVFMIILYKLLVTI